MLAIRRILHPTDFSDLSRPAFDVACALARDYGAELVVCHVEPWPVPAMAEGVVLDNPADETEAAAARLADLEPAAPGVRMVRRLRRGGAAAETLKVAAESAADLIVMGTHGRSGLSRLMMGSVAEHVMRHAPCPVLTVKSPTAAAVAAAGSAGEMWPEPVGM